MCEESVSFFSGDFGGSAEIMWMQYLHVRIRLMVFFAYSLLEFWVSFCFGAGQCTGDWISRVQKDSCMVFVNFLDRGFQLGDLNPTAQAILPRKIDVRGFYDKGSSTR